MAYNSFNKLWESEFDNIVSKKDNLQDLYITQLKLEVHDNFEAINVEDVINKAYIDEKILKNRWSHIEIRKKIIMTLKHLETNSLYRRF